MDQDAIDRLNARSGKAAPYLTGGQTAHETVIDRALGCVSEMARASERGEPTSQWRSTLDDICASLDGYPEEVRAALDAAGLTSVPRIAR